MKVRELMRGVPLHCAATDTVVQAGRTMAETGVGVLPVVDAERRVLGVITDRDVCCALARHLDRAEAMRVGEVAGSPAWTCLPGDDLPTALATMRAHSVRRLPVVDWTGRLEGLLSLDEVVLAAHLLAEGAFDGPVYAEVVETLKAILRPAAALAEVPHPVAAGGS